MDAVYARQKLEKRKRIRCPIGSGIFYPDDKKSIIEQIRSYGLEEGKGGKAKAIIAPHGAWEYSGELIANAFYAAAGRCGTVKRIVILGPVHDKREKGLFLTNSHYFSTPLGKMPVDQEITEELLFVSNHFEINDIPHLREHSIEILLPFAKYCFPNASIAPVLMGQPGAGYIYDLSQALKTVLAHTLDDTLIIISSNLSSGADNEQARDSASRFLKMLAKKDSAALASSILDGRLNACGGALIVSLLDSGLLEKTRAHFSEDNITSAVGAENNTVYYGDIFFE